MISIQPMDYNCFVKNMGLPTFLVNSTTNAIKKRTGIDYTKSSWRPFVKSVNIPTLVVQNKNDGYLDEQFINEFYQDLDVEKNMLWIDIPKQKNAFRNRLAAYDWIGTHPKPILAWFDQHMI